MSAVTSQIGLFPLHFLSQSSLHHASGTWEVPSTVLGAGVPQWTERRCLAASFPVFLSLRALPWASGAGRNRCRPRTRRVVGHRTRANEGLLLRFLCLKQPDSRSWELHPFATLKRWDTPRGQVGKNRGDWMARPQAMLLLCLFPQPSLPGHRLCAGLRARCRGCPGKESRSRFPGHPGACVSPKVALTHLGRGGVPDLLLISRPWASCVVLQDLSLLHCEGVCQQLDPLAKGYGRVCMTTTTMLAWRAVYLPASVRISIAIQLKDFTFLKASGRDVGFQKPGGDSAHPQTSRGGSAA